MLNVLRNSTIDMMKEGYRNEKGYYEEASAHYELKQSFPDQKEAHMDSVNQFGAFSFHHGVRRESDVFYNLGAFGYGWASTLGLDESYSLDR